MRAMGKHNMASGLGYSVADVDAVKDVVCESCALGKQSQQSHPSSGHMSKQRLQSVHIPLPTKSAGGAAYFITLFDDNFSKFLEVGLVVLTDRVPEFRLLAAGGPG